MLKCERSAILQADTEAWLSAGNRITLVPRGASAIDPETGMTGYTRRSYMESQKRGASATRRKYAKEETSASRFLVPAKPDGTM